MIRWLTVAIALAVTCPASAEWTKAQRTRFVGSCVEGCGSVPNLSAAGKAACQPRATAWPIKGKR